MNKRGLEFKLAFFGLIVASIFIVAIGSILTSWNETYDSNIVSNLGEYSTLDDTTTTAQQQQEKIVVKDPSSDQNFEDTTYRGMFGILSSIYAPFAIVFGDGGMIDSVTERFGMPDYLRQGIVIMMGFAITWALIAIVFRLARRSA